MMEMPSALNTSRVRITCRLLRIGFAHIFCPLKPCQATIQRLALSINAVAENFAGRRVFAGKALISALSFGVSRPDLI